MKRTIKKVTVMAVVATLALIVIGFSVAIGAAVVSTSGHTPLVVLGAMLLATGVVLLRRPVAILNP